MEEAHRLLPSAKWWIKADGVDLITSLRESVKFEWNGDVDTGDGYTQELFKVCSNGKEKDAEDAISYS